MPFIESSIHLNYSKIAITPKALKKLSTISDKYKNVVDSLIENNKKDLLYVFDEKKDLNATAEKYSFSDEEVLEFVSRLRNLSYSYQYNKVSDSSDDNIYNLLSAKGYFKNTNLL